MNAAAAHALEAGAGSHAAKFQGAAAFFAAEASLALARLIETEARP